jgi:hypothetical protein
MDNSDSCGGEIVYVAANLYDRSPLIMIGFVLRRTAEAWGYKCVYSSLEEAEAYAHIRLEQMEKLGKVSYDKGREKPHIPGGKDEPFLRHVFRKALQELGYDGWVERL